MPVLNGRGTGDLVIQIDVETPTKLTPGSASSWRSSASWRRARKARRASGFFSFIKNMLGGEGKALVLLRRQEPRVSGGFLCGSGLLRAQEHLGRARGKAGAPAATRYKVPMKRILAAAFAIVTTITAPIAPLTAAELTLERLFQSPSLSGPAPRLLKLSPDGRLATLLMNRPDDRDRYDLWAIDTTTGAAANARRQRDGRLRRRRCPKRRRCGASGSASAASRASPRMTGRRTAEPARAARRRPLSGDTRRQRSAG